MCIYSFFNHLFVVSFFVVVFVLTKTVNYFKKKFNSKFMNIYEKENSILELSKHYYIAFCKIENLLCKYFH
jgi:hypothetical protein